MSRVAAQCDVTVIEPSRGWRAIDFSELWRYRELLYFLTWRDIKVRYKQTVMGAAWAILQPVVTMVIFTIVFGRMAKIDTGTTPYAVFVYAGLLPWMFFANAVASAGASLVGQAHLVTKIYFPRLLVPTASVGAGLVDFALSFVVYWAVMLTYFRLGRIDQLPGVGLLVLPALVVLTLITALGVGYVLASLTVVYRDFRFVIPFMVQVWMFLSPVIYPVTLVPKDYAWLLALNPMTGVIQAYRSVLLGQPMDWALLGISTVIAVTVFVFGLYNFRRAERRFADIV